MCTVRAHLIKLPLTTPPNHPCYHPANHGPIHVRYSSTHKRWCLACMHMVLQMANENTHVSTHLAQLQPVQACESEGTEWMDRFLR